MLAVMEASQGVAGPSNSANNPPSSPDSSTNVQEFLASGRTGRRNALPDILGEFDPQSLERLQESYVYDDSEISETDDEDLGRSKKEKADEAPENSENVSTQTESQHAVVTSSDLSVRLQGLMTSEKPTEESHDQPGTSKS